MERGNAKEMEARRDYGARTLVRTRDGGGRRGNGVVLCGGAARVLGEALQGTGGRMRHGSPMAVVRDRGARASVRPQHAPATVAWGAASKGGGVPDGSTAHRGNRSSRDEAKTAGQRAGIEEGGTDNCGLGEVEQRGERWCSGGQRCGTGARREEGNEGRWC